MRLPRRLTLATAVLLTVAGSARAALVEDQMDIPARVTTAWGKTVDHAVHVTVFFDDSTPAPRPILLLNHGRATDVEGRASMGRARYPAASRWFAERGFLVVVPTRIGYGVTGGEDVEDSGDCTHRNYPPAYRAAADESLQVLATVQRRADARPDRTVVVGQSFGGATSVALAALAPAGVVAAINFAGGGGGDPKLRPEQPCNQPQLKRLFAGYGETARVPMLWVYAENDRFFGRTLPREWFQAFRAAGGQAELQQLPPQGEDGHQLFAKFPQVWQPVVADFLRRQQFEIRD